MEPVLRRPSFVFLFLFLFLVLIPIAFPKSSAEVVTLTADSFTDKRNADADLPPNNISPQYQKSWSPSFLSVLQSMSPAYFGVHGDVLVKEKDTVWFVKFCVPWCKYCNKLGTLWEDLGKAVEAEDEIEIGEVDCSLNKPVCTKVDIHSYPTFKIFYDGEEFAKYQGKRDVELLKSFVLKEADKAAKINLEDDKDEL